MNKLYAKKITGGLSQTTKMPCPSYSLSFTECKAGNKLRKIKGSVCYKCYAARGNYLYPGVKHALNKRFLSIQNKNWSKAIAFLIQSAGSKYFRWHDSGDITSKEHFNKIIEVCKLTPNVMHYLPTKEYALVKEYINKNKIPDNLTIRLSAPMINKKLVTRYLNNVVVTSDNASENVCPATKKTSKTHACGTCRKCWNKKIKTISYLKH